VRWNLRRCTGAHTLDTAIGRHSYNQLPITTFYDLLGTFATLKRPSDDLLPISSKLSSNSSSEAHSDCESILGVGGMLKLAWKRPRESQRRRSSDTTGMNLSFHSLSPPSHSHVLHHSASSAHSELRHTRTFPRATSLQLSTPLHPRFPFDAKSRPISPLPARRLPMSVRCHTYRLVHR
jgi:hypothetical protein